MKWLNFGAGEKERALRYKKWFDENGIRTGEIFELSGIWNVHYMPIGKEQKEICNKQIEYWVYNEMQRG